MAHAQGTTKIEGFAGVPLENITFSNMQLFMDPESQPDKRATDAFFAHDVNDLSLTNVKVKWNTEKTEPLWKNAFSFENIDGLYLDQLKGNPAPTKKGSLIALTNVKNARIDRCFSFDPNALLLQVNGSQSQKIIMTGVSEDHLENRIQKGKEVTPGSVLVN